MFKITHLKLGAPAVHLKLAARTFFLIGMRDTNGLFQKVRIGFGHLGDKDVFVSTPKTKAAKARIVIGTSIDLDRMLLRADWIARSDLVGMAFAQRALRTRRHARLVDAMQKFAMRTLLAPAI